MVSLVLGNLNSIVVFLSAKNMTELPWVNHPNYRDEEGAKDKHYRFLLNNPKGMLIVVAKF